MNKDQKEEIRDMIEMVEKGDEFSICNALILTCFAVLSGKASFNALIPGAHVVQVFALKQQDPKAYAQLIRELLNDNPICAVKLSEN